MKLYKKIICTVFIILAGTAVFASEVGDKVYMEVEIDGDKVGKWVVFCIIEEYDVNGWPIYENRLNKETRYERDKYGSKIYEKLPDGSETWFEPKYDKNNKLIYRKSSTGIEEWFEYDKNGNVIHCKKSDGTEEWYEYNSKGNHIHIKQSDGIEIWYEYNSKGNNIHTKRSDGIEVWYEYDNKGTLVHIKASDGYELWYKYDKTSNTYISEFKDGRVFINKTEYYEDGKTPKKIMAYAYDKH